MQSLSKLVAEELVKNSFIADVLSSGMANISAVSEQLKPTIEKKLGDQVSNLTLAMAIRRQIKTLNPVMTKEYRWPKPDEVTCRNSIYELSISRSQETAELADKIRKALVISPGDFLLIAAGMYEISFCTSQRNKDVLQKLVGRQEKTNEIENLSAITVNWPPLTKDIPGIYYAITRTLALKRISIQSFHTIGAEMLILLDQKWLTLAYETLLELFEDQGPIKKKSIS